MDHEITVTVHDLSRVSARRQDGGEVPDAAIHLDALRRETIAMFQRWLAQAKVTYRPDLEVLGRHLYEVLFAEDVGTFFEKSLVSVKRGERVRLQLVFLEAATELASYPWEFLYHPTRRWFFSTGVDLVLSRYFPFEEAREDTLVGGDGDHALRLLVVVSQPEGLNEVLEAPVLEAIEKVAETHPVEISVLDVATVDNLLEKLEEFTPHVVHFIGHGQFNEKEGRAEIALLDDDETSPSWCPEHSFADYFPNVQAIPRLVFLHLCESARSDPRTSFAGFAPRLLQVGVQAVVAMQYPITNRAAIAFSRAFYRELAKGNPVDQAVQSGRWRITTSDPRAYDSRVFGTPVLYMRSRSGIIRPLASTKLSAVGRPPGA